MRLLAARLSIATSSLLAALGLEAQSAPPPQVEAFGQGCGSSPAAMTGRRPVLGSPLVVRLFGAASARAGSLLLGDRASTPIPLGGGCALYLEPSAPLLPLPMATGATGEWDWSLPLPRDPRLAGLQLTLQCALLDGQASLGVATSSALELRLGLRLGPLAAQPSAEGAHIAQIRKLSSGAWLDLGAPGADPVYGLATGRAYTPRMPWSSTLKGAFLTGEGTHGYVHPVTRRYIDDVWFYDLNAHAWICVKPGSQVDTIELQLNRDSFEVDGDERLVPVAQLGHGYELVTFAEHFERFFMLSAPNTYWLTSMGPRRLAWLGSSSLPGSQRDAPWQFDTVTGLWERSPAGSPAPYLPSSSRGQIVHYVPSQLRVLLWDSSAPNPDLIWYFDCETRKWSSETRPGAPRLNGSSVSCITDREQIYVYGVDKSDVAGLWFYDTQIGTWAQTRAPGVPPARVKYTSAFAGLIYDGAANAIVMKYGASTYPSFHVYELATQSWRSKAIDPPAQLQPPFRWKSLNSFYAPHLGVHVHHVAGTGSGTGRILVHRL